VKPQRRLHLFRCRTSQRPRLPLEVQARRCRLAPYRLCQRARPCKLVS
jgi:hypothetical protein